MKALADPDRLLAAGLATLRDRFAVPAAFPAPVEEAAAAAAAAGLPAGYDDWTVHPFVTLDPASATDLDQAFALEQAGDDLILHYALADIAAFAPAGGAVEEEAWRRGVTLYLPGAKARLYPAVLSENAASLLPDGPRPAIVVTVRCDPAGAVRLVGARRAIIRSRAKLAYETAEPDAVPHLGEFAARMQRGEAARGAARIDPPEQEIATDADGRLRLHFRPRRAAEDANAALSLAANMAMADALFAARTGLFREMAPPDDAAVARLRQGARGLGLDWPATMPLADFVRTLDPRHEAAAAFQLAVRRATGGAAYAPYAPGHVPWHAALGATYCHGTAPMRRLADRYVLDAVLALATGQEPPSGAAERFASLAPVMNAAGQREGAIERAVLDLAEAALLAGREGEVFEAIVLERDSRGARVQLLAAPVLTRVPLPPDAAPAETLHLRLATADPAQGRLTFMVEPPRAL